MDSGLRNVKQATVPRLGKRHAEAKELLDRVDDFLYGDRDSSTVSTPNERTKK